MTPEIEKGKLLVAMPMLVDPNFRQTIVLLCEHGPDGSLGLVVNRPTQVQASKLIRDFSFSTRDGRVFAGGPVAQNVMLILCRGNATLEEHTILEDVFLAKDLDSLKFPGVLGSQGEIRYYLGYAGWAAGQLEAEVKAGVWHLMPGDPDIIFDANPILLWQEMMRKIGQEWSIYSTMPPDLSMN